MNKLFLVLMLVATIGYANPGDTFTTSPPNRATSAQHGLGYKPDKAKMHELRLRSKEFTLPTGRAEIVIPGKVDLAPEVSLPENQGGCGSCWSFGQTKALRSAYMLIGQDPGRLSFNYLLNNCGHAHDEYGCNGGTFEASKNFESGLGPWLESQDPYTQSEGRCKTGLSVAGTAVKTVFVGGENQAPSFQLLAAALSQHHMMAVDVAVCGAWGQYSGGIINRSDCGTETINHIINMVGYDCETSVDAAGNCKFDSNGKPVNGDGYLIPMNNWGENGWGEKDAANGHGGYMRTRWGVDAIATTAVYYEVKGSKPVVDGNFSAWSVCGSGKQTRTCTNPAPSGGGKDCVGPIEQACAAPLPPSPDNGGGLPGWLYALFGAIPGLFIGYMVGRHLVMKLQGPKPVIIQ